MPSNGLHDTPGPHRDQLTVYIPASDADGYKACWVAPFNCTITGMWAASSVTITGDATNTYNFDIDGPDSTTEIGNIDLGAASNITTLVPVAFTMAADVNVDAEAVISFYVDEIGTGQAGDECITWIIDYQSR